MTVKVAISGFGRIGRNVLRAAAEAKRTDLEFVAINDLVPAKDNAHLFKYDSVHGTFPGEVKVSGDSIDVGLGRPIKVLAEKDPSKLPWKDLGIDIVMECTGIFTDKEKAQVHLSAGAKRVLVSAPSKGADITVVYGVNHEKLSGDHKVVSNASCTTNCLAVTLAALLPRFGIERALMNTVHCVTNSQNLVDMAHPDPRRARAAIANLIPTTSDAIPSIGEVLPELAGRVEGMATRVPIVAGSLIDVVVELSRGADRERMVAAFRDAEAGPLAGLLGTTEEELVSSDFVDDPRSAVVDLPLLQHVGDRLWRVIAWYDNEWGYANRIAELASRLAAAGG